MDLIQCGGLIERPDLCLVEILGYEWEPGRSCGILALFADADVPLNYLSISRCADGRRSLAVCVASAHRPSCRPLLERIEAEHSPRAVNVREDVLILTLYGPHFYERVALASEVYAALCTEAVDVHSVASSVNSISVVVDAAERPRTIRSLRSRFTWPE
jgi:aspartokinase